MKVLIKNVQIFSPDSPFHRSCQDILISNGCIEKIASSIASESDQIIEIPHLHVSAGWMDCFAHFCDPGEEYKETLLTGSMAAAAGGFTDVMLVPNTKPAIDNKSLVEYIVQNRNRLPVNLHPIGAITKNIAGKELAEMYDMWHSSAIAFSDGLHPVQTSGILQKALQYILHSESLIIQMPTDTSIGTHGLMNEGIISTQLGLPGIPALAEELMLLCDIELLRYTNSKIHFTGISTAKSVEIIARAKAEGLNISCSVSPYHLYFTEADLQSYDTHLKVNPPLRTENDRQALIEGFKNGTIDCIASHHRPQDVDHKNCEFEYAQPGMETLECVFGAVLSTGISWEDFVLRQTKTIRDIFNLPTPKIEEGTKASLSFFLPDDAFIFEKKHIFSKSANNAFLGQKLKGRAIGIYNKENLHLFEDLTHQK